MLLQHDRHGLPIRAFVPVQFNGRTEVLLLDTGAAHTHLSHGLEGPEVIKDAGSVQLGCASLVVDSWRRRRVPGASERQLAIGTLGNDRILAGATELDLVASRPRSKHGPWFRSRS